MVIGNGLIGKGMSLFTYENDILIFASGVSNSKETRSSEYTREFDLLKSFIGTDKKLVYFSTCSVLYDCIDPTQYIQHKKFMEDFISCNFKDYLIFRLPNVVGTSTNEHTSFNFFRKMILDNLEIKVEEKTTRYFIDIEDVVESLTPIILSKSQNSKTFNVCFNTKIGVIDFINIMAKELEKDPRIILLNQGCSLNIDNKNFLELVDEKFRSIGPDYNYKIIKKYS